MQDKHLNSGSLLVQVGAWLFTSWERLWPLLVPLSVVLMIFLGLSWAGFWIMVPMWLHIVVLAILAVFAVASLFFLRLMCWPGSQDVRRRVERESGLEDRPFLAQIDELELGSQDEFAKALWLEHRERMRARLANLTSGTPRASGHRFDPLGLRMIVPILLFIAFMMSTGSGGGTIGDAFRFHEDPAKLLARLDVWINPPDYTRKPPIFLSTDQTGDSGNMQVQQLPVPQMSQLAGRFVGEGGLSLYFQALNEPEESGRIEIVPQAEEDKTPNPEEKTYSFKLNQSGRISVYSGSDKLHEWQVQVVQDQAPSIRFAKEPSASLSGSLQLSYSVEDDYGVTGAQAIVEPLKPGTDRDKIVNAEQAARFVPSANARPLLEPLEVKLPLPRRRARTGTTKVNRDLSKHPLAGSRVQLTLQVRDDADQIGRSETKTITLPGRTFSDPIARSLIEQRRILSLDANQQQYVVQMMDAVTSVPELFGEQLTSLMAITIAKRRLINARDDDDLTDVTDLLWEIALGIEFGKMSDLEQRLREAQERLSEALENDASDEEIDRLMKELRQAMNELMQALAEQARQNPNSRNPLSQNDMSQSLRQRDLERMMDRIEDLAKSGSKDAARELLSEMQRMMDNLRAGRHMQQRQAEGNQMNRTLDELSDLMQKQQELMDKTYQYREQQRNNNMRRNNPGDNNDQRQNSQRNNRNNPSNPGDQEMTAQEYADAMKQLRDQQMALQEQLDSLNKQLQELGLQPPEGFDEAGKQMGKAGERLNKGEAGEAVGNQGQALEALRRGAQNLMRQMAGDRQQGGQQDGEGESNNNNGRLARDPLGRNNNGLNDSNTRIPGEIDAQNARRIMEAIRKRLSIPQQPIIEKNYLERLLRSR